LFSEILKFKPTLDRAALNSMYRNLTQRFTSVAKRFGQGLRNAMKIGGLFAVTGAILNKLLNPLKNAEEIIDRLLLKGDDAVTNAGEFESDPGKLLRLEALARAKGLDADTLRNLIGKFQGALAEEKLLVEKEKDMTPEQRAKSAPGRLRGFVGETDMAEGFFKFIQSLQAVDPATRVSVQNEVFGERIRGRASEFFNAKDFEDVLKKLPSAEILADAARKLGALSDKRDLQTAIREAEDLPTKAGLVTGKMVNDIDAAARQKNLADNETLLRFDSLKSTSIAVQELTHKFDKMTTSLLSDLMPKVVDAVNGLTKLAEAFAPKFEAFKEFIDDKANKTIDAVSQFSFKVETMWLEFKSSRLYKFGSKLFGG